jgi:hypothetical protein
MTPSKNIASKATPLGVLQRVANSGDGLSGVLSDMEFAVINDLHEAGLVAGNPGPEHLGEERTQVHGMRLTLSGQCKMDEILAAKHSASISGRFVSGLIFVAVFASGVASQVLAQWILNQVDK